MVVGMSLTVSTSKMRYLGGARQFIDGLTMRVTTCDYTSTMQSGECMITGIVIAKWSVSVFGFACER